MRNKECPFFELPIELRLIIYEFALQDKHDVTIGAARIVGTDDDVVYRLYGEGRQPLSGLPEFYEPMIVSEYRPSLLSVTNPETIDLNCKDIPTPFENHGVAAFTLLRVNRQIRKEVLSHFQSRDFRSISLYVQFPHGLEVLTKAVPEVLDHVRSIHIAGSYRSTNFIPSKGVYHREQRLTERYQSYGHQEGISQPDSSTTHLTNLVSRLFGSKNRRLSTVFDMRIYYPGADSYNSAWGDDASPVAIALSNTSTAQIKLETWRGQKGMGIRLCAKPSKDSKRSVTTCWRQLGEGGDGQPEPGSWAIDPLWPERLSSYGEIETEEAVVMTPGVT
ncbi:hypothetical protein K431DRAFT_349153 [Polychaeton citri CBS 116435]|uniref:Uncharacterized protein n=1 Tax=Polychaeton citri CBS 116435 TaxID=1314669 RepID=A0A9P4Q1V4_9PEZI|nr:hypothetical protein K431DRAFT_349153 [Polychaeton citri CBS 116435]